MVPFLAGTSVFCQIHIFQFVAISLAVVTFRQSIMFAMYNIMFAFCTEPTSLALVGIAISSVPAVYGCIHLLCVPPSTRWKVVWDVISATRGRTVSLWRLVQVCLSRAPCLLLPRVSNAGLRCCLKFSRCNI